MKLTVLSAERIKTSDRDAALLVIQISDIGDWDSADAAKKLLQLIEPSRTSAKNDLQKSA
jgi:hypothetical protein